MFFALLSAFALVSPPTPDLTTLKSVYPFGQIYAVTTNSDQSRIYVGEGAAVTILTSTTHTGGGSGNPPFDYVLPLTQGSTLAKVPVDASITSLLRHDVGSDHALFIAGGSFGLLKMDVTEPSTFSSACALGTSTGSFPVTVIDDLDRSTSPSSDNDKWCWDVGIVTVSSTDYVVAVFGALDDSELRVYNRSTLAHVLTVPIQLTSPVTHTGMSYGLCVSGVYVYIAMGTGGIWRADMTNIGSSSVTFAQGPVFDPSSPPSGGSAPTFTLSPTENGRVRSITTAGGYVWAAVDNWGLAEIQISSWPTVTWTPLHDSGANKDTCAQRVSAAVVNGVTHVVVGGGGPVANTEEAPRTSYGRLDSLTIAQGGALVTPSNTVQASQWVFTRTSTLNMVYRDTTRSGGNFIIRASPASTPILRIYDQPYEFEGTINSSYPIGLDVNDYDTTATPIAISFQYGYAGHGIGALGLRGSLRNSAIVFICQEGPSGGTALSTFLDLSNPSCPIEFQSASLAPSVGFQPTDARWTDTTSSNKEWMVTGGNHSYFVSRFDVSNPCAVETWVLASPQDSDCRQGHSYFTGSTFTDVVSTKKRLLMSRAGARYGAVIYDRRDTVQAALAVTACTNGSVCTGTGLGAGGCCSACPIYPDSASACTSAQSGVACPTSGSQTIYLDQIDTHPELANWVATQTHVQGATTLASHLQEHAYTWESKFYNATINGSTHTIAAIAAGYDCDDTDEIINSTSAAGHDGIADDPDFSKAMLVLVDVDASTSSLSSCSDSGLALCSSGTTIPTLSPIGVAFANTPVGNAAAIDIAQICGRWYAFVADLGGRLLIFNINDPTSPFLVTEWNLPLSNLDGYYENVTDVAVDIGSGSDPSYLYIAAQRPGLIRLTLTINCSSTPYLSLPSEDYRASGVVKVDTPGTAMSFELRNAGGYKNLLVADYSCGARFYGDFPTGSIASCQ